MFKSKYLVAGLAGFAVLVAVANLRQCAGSDSAHLAPGTTAPASTPTAASTPAKPAPVEPPEGLRKGYVQRRVVGQDQYGQWTTLELATVPLDGLEVTVDAPKKGSQGKRRTEYMGWIKTDSASSTVLLHVVGYTASVRLQIDDWHSSPLHHSNAWTTDASVGRYVVSLSPGRHRVVLSVTRQRGFVDGPVSVRVQLGSSDTDPVVPVPYAANAGDDQPAPAEPSSTPAPASSVAPAPATTTPAPASSITAPSAPTSTGEPVEQGGSYAN